MKLAQFKTNQSGVRRLGLSHNEGLIDIVSLAHAVEEAAGKVTAWLLDVTDMREVIKGGAEALDQIGALVKEAESLGIAKGKSLAISLETVEFLPAVNAGKILAIGRNYVDHA